MNQETEHTFLPGYHIPSGYRLEYGKRNIQLVHDTTGEFAYSVTLTPYGDEGKGENPVMQADVSLSDKAEHSRVMEDICEAVCTHLFTHYVLVITKENIEKNKKAFWTLFSHRVLSAGCFVYFFNTPVSDEREFFTQWETVDKSHCHITLSPHQLDIPPTSLLDWSHIYSPEVVYPGELKLYSHTPEVLESMLDNLERHHYSIVAVIQQKTISRSERYLYSTLSKLVKEDNTKLEYAVFKYKGRYRIYVMAEWAIPTFHLANLLKTVLGVESYVKYSCRVLNEKENATLLMQELDDQLRVLKTNELVDDSRHDIYLASESKWLTMNSEVIHPRIIKDNAEYYFGGMVQLVHGKNVRVNKDVAHIERALKRFTNDTFSFIVERKVHRDHPDLIFNYILFYHGDNECYTFDWLRNNIYQPEFYFLTANPELDVCFSNDAVNMRLVGKDLSVTTPCLSNSDYPYNSYELLATRVEFDNTFPLIEIGREYDKEVETPIFVESDSPGIK